MGSPLSHPRVRGTLSCWPNAGLCTARLRVHTDRLPASATVQDREAVHGGLVGSILAARVGSTWNEACLRRAAAHACARATLERTPALRLGCGHLARRHDGVMDVAHVLKDLFCTPRRYEQCPQGQEKAHQLLSLRRRLFRPGATWARATVHQCNKKKLADESMPRFHRCVKWPFLRHRTGFDDLLPSHSKVHTPSLLRPVSSSAFP